MRTVTLRWTALGAAGSLGLIMAALMLQKPSSAQANKTPAGEFLGSASCQPCHEKAFTDHAATRHANTLRTLDEVAAKGLAPKSGAISGGLYETKDSGNPSFAAPHSGKSESIALVFGSGRSGMTLAGQFDDEGFLELRMSYLPALKTWYVTPGQEAASNVDLGLKHKDNMAKRCVTCHAVTTPAKGYFPAPEMRGVGCESCHGPGSLHVEAAKRKDQDLKIHRGPIATPHLEAMCAKCHRSINDVSLTTRDLSSTARFQPYGLEMSRCFEESKGKLNCLTCHNPHQNMPTSLRTYEAKCLQCHSSGALEKDRGTASPALICPVNSKDRCVGCHMPQQQVFPGSRVPVSMADHFIWAVRKRKSP